MQWTRRTLIVPAARVELARYLTATVAGPSGVGMWVAELSPTGAAPATHYISEGAIFQSFADLLPLDTYDAEGVLVDSQPGHAAAILAAVQQLNPASTVTLEQVEEVLADADVTQQAPEEAYARLGLVPVVPEEIAP